MLHWAVCFALVCLCWIFFRADTLSDALLILQRLPWAASAPLQGIQVALQTMGLTGGKLAVMAGAIAALVGFDLIQRF